MTIPTETCDHFLVDHAWDGPSVRVTRCWDCGLELHRERLGTYPELDADRCPSCGKPVKRQGACRACAIDSYRASR